MKAKFRLAYRFVIDNNSTLLWDKYVFEITYKEYLLQNQKFNTQDNKAKTFAELLSVNEKAEQLHFLVGIAMSGYVDQLKGKLFRVPDVLGNNYFSIEGYKMDIINTDISDISKHKIGVTFFSKLMLWIDVVNNCYLCSTDTEKENGFNTIMFPMQAGLSVCFFEKPGSI